MVEMKPGEELCPECKGTGNRRKTEEKSSLHFFCFRCNGTGKIDWVQKAMGPQSVNPYDNMNIPLVRHHYPKLLAEELVSVQPMGKPDVVKGYKKE